MATCYDCIHCEACSDAGDAGYSSLKEDVTKCKHFKNKADYAEVKHGYWKDRYNNKYYNHLYECSVCGREALYKPYSDELGHTKIRQELTPVCPHCGAKMDGR
jgi:rubrerythrin